MLYPWVPDSLLCGTLGNELFKAMSHNCLDQLYHLYLSSWTTCKKNAFAVIEIHQLCRGANDRPGESDILSEKKGFLEAALYE